MWLQLSLSWALAARTRRDRTRAAVAISVTAGAGSAKVSAARVVRCSCGRRSRGPVTRSPSTSVAYVLEELRRRV